MTAQQPSRVLLVGHGRMGRLVEHLAGEYGFSVAGIITSHTTSDWPDADVAIDFSVAGAVPSTMRVLAPRRIPVVIGTTGWHSSEAEVRELVRVHQSAVVAAANFALGVNIFLSIVERAGALFASRPEFGAWIHEAHHSAKRDAPSGTALAMKARFEQAGYTHPLDISSTRAGAIPGTHTLGFDSAAETITLTHTTRDRSVFARGALEAARWVWGRSGWFSMVDVINGSESGDRQAFRPA
jgi:4-hydroxy-tetrahydrodipicolinate reductase